MRGIIKLIKDKNTGPWSSIILKNNKFAIAVANNPWIMMAVIDGLVKLSSQNGS